jgi:hypothetical protein
VRIDSELEESLWSHRDGFRVGQTRTRARPVTQMRPRTESTRGPRGPGTVTVRGSGSVTGPGVTVTVVAGTVAGTGCRSVCHGPPGRVARHWQCGCGPGPPRGPRGPCDRDDRDGPVTSRLRPAVSAADADMAARSPPAGPHAAQAAAAGLGRASASGSRRVKSPTRSQTCPAAVTVTVTSSLWQSDNWQPEPRDRTVTRASQTVIMA